MRGCTVLALCALAALVAVPDTAGAGSPLSIFRAVTAPLRTVLGPSRRGGRHFHHRRAAARHAYVSQSRRVADIERGGGGDSATAVPAQSAPRLPSRLNAYEDMIGYALWPDDYGGRFWAYGYSDAMRSVLSPVAATAALPASRTASRRSRQRRGAQSSDIDVTGNIPAGSNPAGGICSAQVQDEAERPIERLEQVIEPTQVQRADLKELRDAVRAAVERGMGACRDTLPQTPAERLQAAADGLWAMRDANILFRTPLANLYATLTDAQTAKLAEALSKDDADKGNDGSVAQTCAAAANDLPSGEIERTLESTQSQRGLDTVRGMAKEMSGYLATSCPQQSIDDPIARLDAAADRVSALLYVAVTFDQLLNGLPLDDSHKQQLEWSGH